MDQQPQQPIFSAPPATPSGGEPPVPNPAAPPAAAAPVAPSVAPIAPANPSAPTTSPAPAIISSGATPAPQPHASHKLLIIVIVTVVLLLVAAVGLVLFLNRDNLSFTSAPPVALSEVQSSFEDYAAYLLGDDASLGQDYDSGDEYALLAALRSDDASEQSDFFLAAQNKYNAFVENYNRSSVISDDLTALILENGGALSFLALYPQAPLLTEAQIVGQFQQHGEESVVNYISDHYSPLSDSDSSPAHLYAESASALNTFMLQKAPSIIASGCFQNGTIVDDCVVDPPLTEEESAEVIDYFGDLDAVYNSAVRSVLISLWGISAQLNGTATTAAEEEE